MTPASFFLFAVVAFAACSVATASHTGQVTNLFMLLDEMNDLNALGKPVVMGFLSQGNCESVKYAFPRFMQCNIFTTVPEVEDWYVLK
jgi:hypothetical protein